jgi:DNA-binding CsgD family transcriptional regulator
MMEHKDFQCGEKAEWATTMDQLGALPIELYRLAFSAPVHRFQELALDAARGALRFDSARWALGMLKPDGPAIHAAIAYRQPPDYGDSGVAFREQDPLLLEALCRPAQTISAAAIGATCAGPHFHDAIGRGHHYGTEPIPGTGAADGVPNLIEGIVFYRTEFSRRFSEPEQLLIQSLVPQLADTWRINRQLSVRGDRRSTAQPNESLALCDRKGLLHAAGLHFVPMMQTEWKDWRGPFIPANLLETRGKAHPGAKIVITATPINDMWLLTARRKSHTDRLTARERDIARHFGRGLDYREVANELRISPATARNHLKNIYDKLEINSKVELAGLLRQIDRPSTARRHEQRNQ